MKKVAVVMNTDRVGGAERSQVLQLMNVDNRKFTFYIPKISGSDELEMFIKKNLAADVAYFYYSPTIYQQSRASSFLGLKFIFLSFCLVFQKELNLSGFDTVYLNGNKAAFYYFLSHFFKKNKKIIWHLRDYFTDSKTLGFFWRMLTWRYINQIKFVSNSESVANNLKRTFSNTIDYEVIYNPSGLIKNSFIKDSFETIGVVSMLTPWKGIHEVYFFAWFYEQELKALGIKKIRLYGDNVYETKGDHSNYKNDLKRMIEKMPNDLIEFAGLKSPETIYSEIDCLIHYSIRPEPFGRVIAEAFATSVPVITTGLGGAGEIVDHELNGFKAIVYDRNDLLEKIRKLKDINIRREITKNGLSKINKMEEEIKIKMLKVLE